LKNDTVKEKKSQPINFIWFGFVKNIREIQAELVYKLKAGWFCSVQCCPKRNVYIFHFNFFYRI